MVVRRAKDAAMNHSAPLSAPQNIAASAWASPCTATYDALAARFRPIFQRIAAGAVQRETDRILPYDPIIWLKEAGFGAVRIPREDGGLGATLPELFALLIELAEADSNVPQALRAHLGAVEDTLNADNRDRLARWLPRFVAGQLVGSGLSESGTNTLGTFDTTLTADGDRRLLNGTKFYSTGTLFADWINFGAMQDGEIVTGLVSATAAGVTRHDDWKGFGQKLTGSGTTVFVDSPVDPQDIFAFNGRSKYRTAFYQLVHLATLSGIGRAATRDLAQAVAKRKRTYSHAAAASSAIDPQVLQVVGQVRGLAFAAGAITLQGAESAQRVYLAAMAGDTARADAEAILSEIIVSQSQAVVAKLVLEATEKLFDALGASATDSASALDRHWRNARTISSHNPLIYKQRIVGDYAVNGTLPPMVWLTGQA
jgi:alkylation response protein AidB-like acyl-CoA dehydrogenase